jgi:2'-5' RNA ligase
MRCFIAIDIPEKVKDYLSTLQASIPPEDIRKVDKDNIHLTLAFLGEMDEESITRCINHLKEIKFEKFDSSLGKMGFFPSEEYIRVIWVSLEPAALFRSFHSDVLNSLSEFPIDKRFEPHVTLARIRYLKDKEDFLKSISSLRVEKKSFSISSFSLKKSTLTSQGPVYEDIEKFNLL